LRRPGLVDTYVEICLALAVLTVTALFGLSMVLSHLVS